jgi:large subunit ribosomal protein L7/L12
MNVENLGLNLTSEHDVVKLLDTVSASTTVREVIMLITKANSLDVANIVSILEKVYGVSAAPVAVGNAGPSASAEAKEEKTSFQIKLKDVSKMSKLGAVKVIRAIFTEMSLKEASDLLKDGVVLDKTFNKNEVDDIVKQFSDNGVLVEKV